MGLKEKLQADLTDAIRSRNEVVSGTVRMLLAAITNEEVAGKADGGVVSGLVKAALAQ